MSKLDIILFGASGFTGTYCIEVLHKLAKVSKPSFTWGIAGRSVQKLKTALQECEKDTGHNLSLIPIIEADVFDFKSLERMTASAKVVINCCGPYRLYGEPVVKACIETATHQVDVTGEPLYMEMIQYKYHNAAQAKGIYIVSACGFDSIPADMGVLFLQDKFNGTINSIESYVQFSGGKDGIQVNYGTYESAVRAIADTAKTRQLRKNLYSTTIPNFQPQLKPRPPIHKSELINSWCMPFTESDRSVIQRTQRYLFENKKRRPAQVQIYLGVRTFGSVMRMVVMGLLFTIFAKFTFGRALLLKFPSFFTGGLIKHNQPLKSMHKNTSFSMTMYADGWNEELLEVADEFKIPPNKTMIARITGDEPAYALTATAVTLSAITILTEHEKLPHGGGVYTPGGAFMKTTMTEKLQSSGIKFEIL